MTSEEPTGQTPANPYRSGVRTLLVLLVTCVAAALAVTTGTAGTTGKSRTATVGPVRLVSTTLTTAQRRWSYDWPVKPFDRQHPVRGFLNDPRIGANSSAFHFGIDISAPDGTAVYAVEAGTAYLDSPRAIGVASLDRSHCFGYWHIVPAVADRQFVRRHQLIGHIAKGWQHVHFAESRNGVYLNPLRNGGLGPYADHTAPRVSSVRVSGSDLVAVACDLPDPRVPGSWADEPVTPALIEIRSAGGGWRVAVDFRATMLARNEFDRVYTPATRQNHEGEPGRFSFYLDHGFVRHLPRTSSFTIQIRVSDVCGNSTLSAVRVSAPTA